MGGHLVRNLVFDATLILAKGDPAGGGVDHADGRDGLAMTGSGLGMDGDNQAGVTGELGGIPPEASLFLEEAIPHGIDGLAVVRAPADQGGAQPVQQGGGAVVAP
jgi:hypothetical protein